MNTTTILKKKRENSLIDLHSHILPDIDDGATDIKESIEMAKAAAKIGINTIVATPHKIKSSNDITISEIKRKILQLNRELQKQKISVTILPGAENYAEYDYDLKIRINNKRYYLIEFPRSEYPDFCDDIIDEIINKKIIPIIAHPETNDEIKKKPKIIERLINEGCLMQLDLHSFFNKSTKEFALFLLKNNAYHLIGSNAHRMRSYDIFSKGLRILNIYIGEERTNEISKKLPLKIIKGEKYIPKKIELNGKFEKRNILGKIFR